MDTDEIKKIIVNMERVSDNGQDLARSTMDREPGQRRQNTYWRYMKQDLKDLRKLLGIE